MARKNGNQFKISDIYKYFPKNKRETVRARVYTNLGSLFEKVSRGVYCIKRNENSALLINGDGRDLSSIPDASIDAIITDHPWVDNLALKGTRKNMAKYDGFLYEFEDFLEKYRVLKDGSFLIENLPQESETNFEYLHQIKKMAIKAGFKFWCVTVWKKGKLVHNTGRVAKNKEFLYFFTKGKARKLRVNKNTRQSDLMSGTTQIVPCELNFQPASPKNKKHQAEKPIELLKALIELVTNKGELVLDQFAGSFNIVDACLETQRDCIAIEINEEFFNRYTREKEAS
jgi:site-specific DNA-methyltransferase (adenine-specific)